MLGLGRALRIGKKPFEIQEVNKGYYRFLMDAVVNFNKKDAPLSKEFENGTQAIAPIVFSHGLSACPRFYSALMSDYASHGYIIFALSHRDMSTSYCNDKDGNFYYYDCEAKVFDLEYRQKQVDIREKEIVALIDEICEGKGIKTKMGYPNINIDTNRLISMGHSYGGITALRGAHASDKVKAVVSYDPWMFMHYKQAESGEMKVN